MKKLKLDKNRFLNSKTIHCQHELGCLADMIKQSSQAYLFTLGMKFLFKIIFRIPRILRKPKLLLKILTNKFNYKFAIFPALLVFLFKGILCAMRRFNGKKVYNPIVAGFLASFISLSQRPQEGRVEWATFFLGRAL